MIFFFIGNIFISYNASMEECQHSGDEGFDENDTPGPRKRITIYKIGKNNITELSKSTCTVYKRCQRTKINVQVLYMKCYE